MMRSVRNAAARLAPLGAALVALGTAPAAADTTAPAAIYLVSDESDTQSDTTVSRETLGIATYPDRFVVMVANGQSQRTFAVAAASDGEVREATADRSVACYNLARALLASFARAPAQPFVVPVASLGRILPIEVALKGAAGPDGSTVVDGSGSVSGVVSDGSQRISAGVIVATHLVELAGALDQATFAETTVAGDRPQALGRNICSISRVARPVDATALGA